MKKEKENPVKDTRSGDFLEAKLEEMKGRKLTWDEFQTEFKLYAK
jgi:hypothetical protein